MSELNVILAVIGVGLTAVGLMATIWWRIQTLINRSEEHRRKDVQDLHAKVENQRLQFDSKMEIQAATFIRRDEMLLHIGRIEDGVKDIGKRFDDVLKLFMQAKLNGQHGSD